MSIDRSRISEPIPGEEPSGEWLRREGTYAAIQEAIRSDPGDPSYGIPEKRPDWDEAISICAEALYSKTKDFYISACLLEALARTQGPRGLAEGLWIIAEIHARFWGDFHPRLRDEGTNLDARVNQIEALIQNFPRILDALAMNEGREILTRFDWRYAGTKLPGGDQSPWTEEQRSSAARESSWDFYDGCVRAMQEAEKEFRRFDDLLDEHYGREAPSVSDSLEQLVEVRELYEKLLQEKGPSPHEERARSLLQQTGCDFIDIGWLSEKVRAGVHVSLLVPSLEAAVNDRAGGLQPEEGWQGLLERHWERNEAYAKQIESAPPPVAPAAPEPGLAPAPAAAPVQTYVPVAAAPVSGDALAAILGGCNAMRASEPGNPISYLVLRQIGWRELAKMGPGDRPSAPPAGVRERCKGLFEQLKWAELLELCEGTLASGVGAGWVDLHRFSAASMGQLGGAHRPVRAEIVRALRECLSKHPWLLDATLSDGTQAADDTSRGWVAAEVSPDAGEGAGAEASGSAAAPTGGGLLDEARDLLSSDGLEKAIGLLQRSAGDARWGRERACALQDLGTLCLEAQRGDLAIPVLERLCDELRRARVEDWEGPDFLGGALEALYGSYTLVSDRTAAQTARMRDIADELAKVDLGRRLRLDESKL